MQAAAKVATHANQSSVASELLTLNPVELNPSGQKICIAKNAAKLTITPTTAAVIAVKGAVNFKLFWVDSINGAPIKININDGKKVKNVTKIAAIVADNKALSTPKNGCVQPPTNPTNVTTMISGPGVVSPNAKPSIICAVVSQ